MNSEELVGRAEKPAARVAAAFGLCCHILTIAHNYTVVSIFQRCKNPGKPGFCDHPPVAPGLTARGESLGKLCRGHGRGNYAEWLPSRIGNGNALPGK